MSVFVDIAPDDAVTPAPGDEPRAGHRWRARLTRAALPLLSVVVFGVVWQLAASAGIWNQTFVPFPSTVWRAFVDVSTTHDGVRGYAGYLLWEHLYMTLRRVLVGVVIGVALGVLLGLAMGSIGWLRSVLEPWLTFLRALPPLAYFFLLVIWLGIDEAPKITLLALAALPRLPSRPPRPSSPRRSDCRRRPGLSVRPGATSSATSSSPRRYRRPSPASGWLSVWRTRRWSPQSCSTESPESGDLSKTQAITTTPPSCS